MVKWNKADNILFMCIEMIEIKTTKHLSDNNEAEFIPVDITFSKPWDQKAKIDFLDCYAHLYNIL